MIVLPRRSMTVAPGGALQRAALTNRRDPSSADNEGGVLDGRPPFTGEQTRAFEQESRAVGVCAAATHEAKAMSGSRQQQSAHRPLILLGYGE